MGDPTGTKIRAWRLLALALVLMVCSPGGCGRRPGVSSERPNLVLIVIDTLRADHLGCYGYTRPTSPNIDTLATQSTVFENAVAPSSWTLPSVASILTALYPTRHQAVKNKLRLPEHRETIAEILAERGYATGAVTSGIFVTAQFGVDQGFADFDESWVGPPTLVSTTVVSSPGVTEVAIDWLERHRHSPFFLFLHYFDPHAAYMVHPGFEFGEPYDGWVDPTIDPRFLNNEVNRFTDEDLGYLESCYDSEVAFTDDHVGRLLAALDTLGLDSSTIVVLTSDHGEEFMDHGFLGHRRTLYGEVLHVPLILRDPRTDTLPGRVTHPVGLVNLMPTLLEMLEIDWDPAEVDGRSFLNALHGKAEFDSLVFSELCKRNIEAETPRRRRQVGSPLNLRALRTEEWKLIRWVDLNRYELYNLASDPDEQRPVKSREAGEGSRRLKPILSRWMQKEENLAREENPTKAEVSLDEETKEQLRALGYIQ